MAYPGGIAIPARFSFIGLITLFGLVALSFWLMFGLGRSVSALTVVPPDSCFAFEESTGTITKYHYYENNITTQPVCPKAIEIPGSINGVIVRSITGLSSWTGAFSGSQLTSVIIPDSVTTIGQRAFSGNYLENIDIPEGVESIGDRAFSDNRMTSVTIPNSVVSIADNAFLFNKITAVTHQGVTHRSSDPIDPDLCFSISGTTFNSYRYAMFQDLLTSGNICLQLDVVIPEGITVIGSRAFIGNLQGTTGLILESIVIPEGVVSIGDYAFAQNNLVSVVIPDTVTSVGRNAFDRNRLESVVIGQGVTTIGNVAFESNRLTELVIPDSVVSIGDRAFQYNRLESVELGASVSTIGSDAFYGNKIQSITIPDSVTSIGSDAFWINRFDEITYLGTTYKWSDPIDLDYCFVTSGTEITRYRYADFSDMLIHGKACLQRDVVIPDGIESIGKEAFVGGHLESVVLPEGIVSIGELAFSTNKLTSIVIPSSLRDFGRLSFSYNELKNVVISDGVTSVGELAFYVNPLEHIDIPDSVTAIGQSAFADNELVTINLGDGVVDIGDMAFMNNRIASVVIPDSTTTIGWDVFLNNQIESLHIGSSVTHIEGNAFSTNRLKSVTIPDSTTYIGNYAFDYNQLETVYLGSGVTSLSGNEGLASQGDYEVTSSGRIASGSFVPSSEITRVYTSDFQDLEGVVDLIECRVDYYASSENCYGYLVNPASISVEYLSSSGDPIADKTTMVGRSTEGDSVGGYDQEYMRWLMQDQGYSANQVGALYYRVGDVVDLPEPIEIVGYQAPDVEPSQIRLDSGEVTITYRYLANGEDETGGDQEAVPSDDAPVVDSGGGDADQLQGHELDRGSDLASTGGSSLFTIILGAFASTVGLSVAFAYRSGWLVNLLK